MGESALTGTKKLAREGSQVVRGAVVLNGTTLTAGDGAAVSKEAVLQIRATDAAELLLFDLA
jgi:quercetin 2,3-dioxygenase